MEMSDGEKLIAIMLADMMQATGVSGEVDPKAVKEAITGGDLWSLEYTYPGIFHGEEPSAGIVRETGDILSMCSYVEYSINALSAAEKAEIPDADRTVFFGFDANNEDHHGVALAFIEKMNRFSEFKGRAINSQMPSVDRYRRMMAAYRGCGSSKNGLSLAEIQTILTLSGARH